MSTRLYQRLSSIGVGAAGMLSVCVAVAVLVGWHTGNRDLIRLLGSSLPMGHSIAAGLLGTGMGLLFLALGRRLATIVGGSVGLFVGLLELSEFVAKADLRIERLLMPPERPFPSQFPMLVELESALCLCAAGIALIIAGWRPRWISVQPVLGFLGALVLSTALILVVANLTESLWLYEGGRVAPTALHTAVAFALLGAALCGLAFEGRQLSRERTWTAFAAAGIAVVLTTGLWHLMASERQEQTREHVAEQLEQMGEQLRTGLGMRLFQQGWLAAVDGFTGPKREEGWHRQAQMFFALRPSLVAIEWRDPDLRLEWSWVAEDQKTVFHSEPVLPAKTRQDIETVTPQRGGYVQMSPPEREIPMVQVYAARYERGRLIGYMVSVFRCDRLMANVFQSEIEARDFAFVISYGGKTILDHSRAEWSTIRRRQWSDASLLQAHGTQWELELWPTRIWLARQSSLPELTLLYGLLSASMLGAMILLVQKSRARASEAEQARSEVEAHLAERRRAERELERSAELLQRRNKELALTVASAHDATEMKSRFLAAMSHEIRTPLSGILGMNELLLCTRLDAEQREYADTVKDSTNSLLGIVNDILDFSKIEAGKLEIETVAFDPRVLVRSVQALLLPPARAKELAFDCSVGGEIPDFVCGDPARIKQVLLNLVNNAVKFTEKGRVTLTVESARRSSDPNGVTFEVRDTGIGIAPHEMEHIFQEFTQADSSTTRRFGGTGLGLSISRQLVAMMGGELQCESRSGKGSRFWFQLSLQPGGEPAGAATGAGIAGVSSDHKRILVVEDNEINRIVAVRLLAKEGCRVDAVSDGKGAIAACSARRYQLILMDVNMPDMDGLEATAALRRLEGNEHHTPIVAMTARAMEGDREMCLTAGMDDYLTKPVSRNSLRRILDTLASPAGDTTPGR
ncbi:MAG: response regulator [bacterium]|nr:response regulator [bacterium]